MVMDLGAWAVGTKGGLSRAISMMHKSQAVLAYFT